MRLLLLPICGLLLTPVQAGVIDRIAITVGHNVITQLAVDEDIRVVAMINGQPVNRQLEKRRSAADRLVQRLLIQHEMEVSRYPLPTDEEVNTYLEQIQDTLGGENHIADLLRSYSLTRTTLLDYLKSQLTMLRFIEYRFNPDVNVSDADVENAYQREIGLIRQQHPGELIPPLDEAKRAGLSQKLSEERTDAALDAWLAESRKQVNIVYLDGELQ